MSSFATVTGQLRQPFPSPALVITPVQAWSSGIKLFYTHALINVNMQCIMKRAVTSILAVLLVTVGSLYAQEQQSDTTQSERQTKEKAETGQTDPSKQEMDMAREPRTEQPLSDRYNASDLVIIQQNEIPQSLRETLKDEKYAGWENSIIYHNTRTGEYLISPRPYRFDSEGNPVSYEGQKKMERQDRRQEAQPMQDQATSRRQEQTDPNRKVDEANNPEQQQDQHAAAQQSDQERRTEQTDTQQSEAYRTDRKDTEGISTEGMNPVQKDQYPEGLRETLKDSKYEGWENGKVYMDPSTGEYVLVIDDNAKAGSAKRYYRFDSEGKEMTDENSGGLNDDQ